MSTSVAAAAAETQPPSLCVKVNRTEFAWQWHECSANRLHIYVLLLAWTCFAPIKILLRFFSSYLFVGFVVIVFFWRSVRRTKVRQRISSSHFRRILSRSQIVISCTTEKRMEYNQNQLAADRMVILRRDHYSRLTSEITKKKQVIWNRKILSATFDVWLTLL